MAMPQKTEPTSAAYLARTFRERPKTKKKKGLKRKD